MVHGALSPQRIMRSLFRFGQSKSYTVVTDAEKKSTTSPLKKTTTAVGSLAHYFKKHDVSPGGSMKASQSNGYENEVGMSTVKFTTSPQTSSEEEDFPIPKRRSGQRRKLWKKKQVPQEPCAEFFKHFKPNDLIGY